MFPRIARREREGNSRPSGRSHTGTHEETGNGNHDVTGFHIVWKPIPRFARHDHFFVFEDRAMRGRGDKGLSLPTFPSSEKVPVLTKEGKRKTLDPRSGRG